MPDLTSTLDTHSLWALIGYGLGSIPFGLLVARLFGLGNLRQIGSGNIGATNVLRTGSKGAAALTLILDGGKGAAAVLIARHFQAEDAAQVAGFAAFLGHLFPVWLGFRGGKGVATFLGTLLALSPVMGAALCAAWLVGAVITRYSSVAALFAAALSPVFAIWFTAGHALIMSFLMMVLIYIRHSQNLGRIKAGTETKIGQSSAPPKEA
jgi:glycerol-3-phosphate acyltransferase PlsY